MAPGSDAGSDAGSDTRPAGEDYSLPEVTRALRAFGSRRGLPGSDHDRFFAPLVAALQAARAAHASGAGWHAVDAIDALRVERALRDALGVLAVERAEGSAPDARALEAELEELCEPVFAALAALAECAALVRTSTDARRRDAWCAWTAQLASAFAALDRAWIADLPALADARGGRGRLWRRVLRGTGGVPGSEPLA